MKTHFLTPGLRRLNRHYQSENRLPSHWREEDLVHLYGGSTEYIQLYVGKRWTGAVTFGVDPDVTPVVGVQPFAVLLQRAGLVYQLDTGNLDGNLIFRVPFAGGTFDVVNVDPYGTISTPIAQATLTQDSPSNWTLTVTGGVIFQGFEFYFPATATAGDYTVYAEY